MFSWFKKKKVVSDPEVGLKSSVSPAGHDVSEPVLSLVESFKEKGRWAVKHERTYRILVVKDTKLDRNYYLATIEPYFGPYDDRFGVIRIEPSSLPNWMTFDEKIYVCGSVYELTRKLNRRAIRVQERKAQKALKEERQKMIDLYVRKEENE